MQTFQKIMRAQYSRSNAEILLELGTLPIRHMIQKGGSSSYIKFCQSGDDPVFQAYTEQKNNILRQTKQMQSHKNFTSCP